jgi:hypothetical protein
LIWKPLIVQWILVMGWDMSGRPIFPFYIMGYPIERKNSQESVTLADRGREEAESKTRDLDWECLKIFGVGRGCPDSAVPWMEAANEEQSVTCDDHF